MSNVSNADFELTTNNDETGLKDERSLAEREIGALADKLAQARRRQIDCYEQSGLTRQEALAKVQEPSGLADHFLRQPLQSTTHSQLDEIAASDPQAAMQRWHSMIDEAGDQIATGHSAVDALVLSSDDAWQHAQFMALCDELADGLPPRTGIERQLIHAMAQAFTTKNFWLHRMMLLDALDASSVKDEKFAPPRVSTYQAVDQASTMVDRYDRMFMRALRQLRDLRRYMPTIVVNNAGQVNIGQQQLNVDSSTSQPRVS